MNTFIFCFPLSIICTLIHLWMIKGPKTLRKIFHIVLLYQLVFNVGLESLINFYGNMFMPKDVSTYLGWPSGSPFQRELAYANLTFGVLGIFCLWIKDNFWTATVFGASIWMLADAYEHIRQILIFKNKAPGNVGMPLFEDLFMPIFLLSLLVINVLLEARRS